MTHTGKNKQQITLSTNTPALAGF